MKKLVTAAVAAVLLPIGTTPVAAAPATDTADHRVGLPSKVVVRDSRTSAEDVDIASLELVASGYYSSEQDVSVRVPGGMRAGHHLTVWFDIDGDPAPEGRYDLQLSTGRGKHLRIDQVLRKGETWGTDGVRRPFWACVDEDLDKPVYYVSVGDRVVGPSFDVFGCFGAHPAGDSPGAWRAVASLTRGGHGDSVPSARRWSPAVRGWAPCGPPDGSC